MSGKLKPVGVGEAKASLKRAPLLSRRIESDASDPKPGDLAMARLKAR